MTTLSKIRLVGSGWRRRSVLPIPPGPLPGFNQESAAGPSVVARAHTTPLLPDDMTRTRLMKPSGYIPTLSHCSCAALCDRLGFCLSPASSRPALSPLGLSDREDVDARLHPLQLHWTSYRRLYQALQHFIDHRHLTFVASDKDNALHCNAPRGPSQVRASGALTNVSDRAVARDALQMARDALQMQACARAPASSGEHASRAPPPLRTLCYGLACAWRPRGWLYRFAGFEGFPPCIFGWIAGCPLGVYASVAVQGVPEFCESLEMTRRRYFRSSYPGGLLTCPDLALDGQGSLSSSA
ncbi:hypothetical protein PsYK624_030950 [Phanerochaete sordida]|uniref:Uncharacterized protein n=1 Tax=Phanerochaete sordida TaxID=48140 RepID=A0A9P3LAP8_9APHY|nr:hypothetical protein PsYK624_030950 [Phanerochaete sordida]